MSELLPTEPQSDDTEAYDRWLRAKVEASLADQRPPRSHAAAMEELDALIDRIERGSPAR